MIFNFTLTPFSVTPFSDDVYGICISCLDPGQTPGMPTSSKYRKIEKRDSTESLFL